MIGQERILSYAVERLRDKLSAWFPDEDSYVFDGTVREGIALAVTGVAEDSMTNPMETLRLTVEDEEGEPVEVMIPAPRMVYLKVAVVPCSENALKALDLSALIKRNIHDDPAVRLEECLWHGCREPLVHLEFQEASPALPGELSASDPYRWDFSLRLGINSAREERVVKVRERQFTAVSK